MATRSGFPPRGAILVVVLSVLIFDFTSGRPLRTGHSPLETRGPAFHRPKQRPFNCSPYIADSGHNPFGSLPLYPKTPKSLISPFNPDPSELFVSLPSGESVPYDLYESCVSCYEGRLPVSVISAKGKDIPVSTCSEALRLCERRPESQVRLPNGSVLSATTLRAVIQGYLEDTAIVHDSLTRTQDREVAQPTVILPSGEQLPYTEFERIVNNYEKRTPMRVVTPNGLKAFLGLTEFILVTQNRHNDLVVLDNGDVVTAKRFRDVIRSRYEKDAVVLLPTGATIPLDSEKLSLHQLPSKETNENESFVNLRNGEVITQSTYDSIVHSEKGKLPKVVIKPSGQVVRVNSLPEILAVTQNDPSCMIELEGGMVVSEKAYESAVSFSAISFARHAADVAEPNKSYPGEVSVIMYGGLELPYNVYETIVETFMHKMQYFVTVSKRNVPVHSLLDLITVTHGNPDDIITLPNRMKVKSTTFRGVINEHIQNDVFLRTPTGKIVPLATGQHIIRAARSQKKNEDCATSAEGSVTLSSGERIPFHLYELIISSSLSEQPITVLSLDGRIHIAKTLPDLLGLTSGHPEYLIRLPDGFLVTADTYGNAVKSRSRNAEIIQRICGCANLTVPSSESSREIAAVTLPTGEKIPYNVYESIIDSYVKRTPVQTTTPESENVYVYPLGELLLVTNHQPNASVYLPNGNVTTTSIYRDAVVAFTEGGAQVVYPSGLVKPLGPCSLNTVDSRPAKAELSTASDDCKFIRIKVPGRGVQFIMGDGLWYPPRYCRIDCGGGKIRYEPADPTRISLPHYESLARPDGKILFLEAPRSKTCRPSAKATPETRESFDPIPVQGSPPNPVETETKSRPEPAVTIDGSGKPHTLDASQPPLEHHPENATPARPGQLLVMDGNGEVKSVVVGDDQFVDIGDDFITLYEPSSIETIEKQVSYNDNKPTPPPVDAHPGIQSTPEDVETGRVVTIDSGVNNHTLDVPAPDSKRPPEGTSIVDPGQVLVVNEDGQLHTIDNGPDSLTVYEPSGIVTIYEPTDIITLEDTKQPQPDCHSLPVEKSVLLVSGERISSDLYELIVCNSVCGQPFSVLSLDGSIYTANSLDELKKLAEKHPESLIKLQDGSTVTANTYGNALNSPQENTKTIKTFCKCKTSDMASTPNSESTPSSSGIPEGKQSTPQVETSSDPGSGQVVVIDEDGSLHSVDVPKSHPEVLPGSPTPKTEQLPDTDDGHLPELEGGDDTIVLYEPPDSIIYEDSEIPEPDCHSLPAEKSVALLSGERIPSHLYELIICSSVSGQPISILGLDQSIYTANNLTELKKLTERHPEYLIKLQDGSTVTADTYVNAVISPQENTEAIMMKCRCNSTGSSLPLSSEKGAGTELGTGGVVVIDGEGHKHHLDVPEPPCKFLPEDTPKAEPGQVLAMDDDGKLHAVDVGDDCITLYEPSDVVSEVNKKSELDCHSLPKEKSVELISGERISSHLYELIICNSVGGQPISILSRDGSIYTANNLTEVSQLTEGHPEYLIKLQDGSSVTADTYVNALNSPQANTEAIKKMCSSKVATGSASPPSSKYKPTLALDNSTETNSTSTTQAATDTETGEVLVIDENGHMHKLDFPEPHCAFLPEDSPKAEPGQVLVIDDDGQLHAVDVGNDTITLYEPSNIVTVESSGTPKSDCHSLPEEKSVALISGERISSHLYELIICNSISGLPIRVLSSDGSIHIAKNLTDLYRLTEGHPEYLIKLQDGSTVTADTYVNAVKSPQGNTEENKKMCGRKTTSMSSPPSSEPTSFFEDDSVERQPTLQEGTKSEPGNDEKVVVGGVGSVDSLGAPEAHSEVQPELVTITEAQQVPVTDDDSNFNAFDDEEDTIFLYEPDVVTYEDSETPEPDCHGVPVEESVTLVSGERIPSHLYESIICNSVSGQPFSVITADGSILTANAPSELDELTEGHPEYLIKLQDGSSVTVDTYANALNSPQKNTEAIKMMCACNSTGLDPSVTSEKSAGTQLGPCEVVVIGGEGHMHDLDGPEPPCKFLPEDTPKAEPGQVLAMDDDGKLHAVDIGDDSIILYEPSDMAISEDHKTPEPDCHTLPKEKSVALISGERIPAHLYELIICSSVSGQPISVLSLDGSIYTANNLSELSDLTEGHPEYLIKLQDGSLVTADTYVNALNSPQTNTEDIKKLCGCKRLVEDEISAPEQLTVVDSNGQIRTIEEHGHVPLAKRTRIVTYKIPPEDGTLPLSALRGFSASGPESESAVQAFDGDQNTPKLNKRAAHGSGTEFSHSSNGPDELTEESSEANGDPDFGEVAATAPPIPYYPMGVPAHYMRSPWYVQCPFMRPYFVTPHVDGFHPVESYHQPRSPQKPKSKKKSKKKKKKKRKQLYDNFEDLPEVRPTYTPIYGDAGELQHFVRSDFLLRANSIPNQEEPFESWEGNDETHIYPSKPNTVVSDDDGNTFVFPLNLDGSIAFDPASSYLDALPESDLDDLHPTPFAFPETEDLLPPSSDPAYIIVHSPEGYLNFVPRYAAPGREIVLPSGDKHILPVFPSRFIEPSVPYHAFTTPDGLVYKVPYGRGYDDDVETSTISVKKVETSDGETVEVPIETKKRSDGSITTLVNYSPIGQANYKTIIDVSGEVYCVPISGTTTHHHPNSKIYKTIIDTEGDEFHVPESQLKSASYRTIIDVDGHIYEIPSNIHPVDNLRRAQHRTGPVIPETVSPTVHTEVIPALYKPEVYVSYYTPVEYASPYYYHSRPYYSNHYDPIIARFYNNRAVAV